jgi:hypothetical protein
VEYQEYRDPADEDRDLQEVEDLLETYFTAGTYTDPLFSSP